MLLGEKRSKRVANSEKQLETDYHKLSEICLKALFKNNARTLAMWLFHLP